MYVCICHAVTRTTFDEVVATGARSVDAVAERCGAGTGCGSCLERLSCLLSTVAPSMTAGRLDAVSASA